MEQRFFPDPDYKTLFEFFDFDDALNLSIAIAKRKIEQHIDRMGFFIYLNIDALPDFSIDKWLYFSKELGIMPFSYKRKKRSGYEMFAMDCGLHIIKPELNWRTP